MPYIHSDDRPEIDKALNTLIEVLHRDGTGHGVKSPGELNYAITRLVYKWLYAKKDGKIVDSPRYHALNEAIGVLDCVKMELYRRHIGPYEDEKAELNGDVYVADE